MIKLYWNKVQLNFEKVEWSGTDTQASRQITFSIPVNPYDKGFKNASIKLGDIVTLYSDKEKLFIGVITSKRKKCCDRYCVLYGKGFYALSAEIKHVKKVR